MAVFARLFLTRYPVPMSMGNRPHRKRCKRWDIPWDAHWLTFSCFQRRPFFRGRESPGWFLESLDAARGRWAFDLWGYVVMPEHVHLLLLPQEGVTIRSILRAVKQPTARRAIRWFERNRPSFLEQMTERRPGGKVTRRFWQTGGGYDRNLRSTRDVHEKLHYLHGNPVRRGLVASPGDWPWSSWRAWEDGTNEPIAIDRESFPVLGPV